MAWIEAFGVSAGLASIASLVYAVWVHLKAREQATAEAAKVMLYQERMMDIQALAMAAANSCNMIVRACDSPDAQVAQLQMLARDARGVALLVVRQTGQQRDRLATWRFGELFPTEVPVRDERPDPLAGGDEPAEPAEREQGERDDPSEPESDAPVPDEGSA